MAKEKKVKKDEWKLFGAKAYTDFIRHGMFHFSAKACNSSLTNTGIRISKDNGEHLPANLLSVSRIHSGVGILTDYVSDAKDSPIYKQISAIKGGNENELFENIDTAEADHIRSQLHLLEQASFRNTDKVDSKSKQLLFPLQDTYVSITPLHSSGFSKELKDRLDAWNDALPESEKKRKFRFAAYPIGGSKPQNVGKNALSMQKVAIFQVPKERQDLRASFARVFGETKIEPQRKLLIALRDFYIGNGFYDGTGISSAESREDEKKIISDICIAMLRKLKQIEQSLADLDDEGIAEARTDIIDELDGDKDIVKLGILFPEHRTSTWVDAVSFFMIDRILSSTFRIDNHSETLPVHAHAAVKAYASTINQLVRENFNV